MQIDALMTVKYNQPLGFLSMYLGKIIKKYVYTLDNPRYMPIGIFLLDTQNLPEDIGPEDD